MLEFAYFLDNG